MQRYSYNGPVDHTLPIDLSKIKGKSVVFTGGANGRHIESYEVL